MRLIALWDQQLQAMESAPEAFRSSATVEDLRKIDRLVAFVDGVVENDEDAGRHPLANDIRNWAPWNVGSLARLSDNLSIAAARAQGFGRLQRSLGKPGQYGDAVVELRLAAELLEAGLEVSFVAEAKDKKTSDLLLEFDGQRLYVEVTHIGQSAEAKEAFSFFNREDWRVAEFAGLNVEVRLTKFLSKPRLKELVEALVARATEVRASGTPTSYAAEGLLLASIKKSTSPRTSSFGVSFPQSVDEVDRLIGAIRRKAEQLPQGYPGLLIIVDEALHVSPWEHPNFSPVVEKLEEYVYEHSRLTGLLIMLPFNAAQVDTFAVRGENWVAWRKLGPVSLAEDRLFIRNRYAGSPIDDRVLAAFGCPGE